MQWLMYRWVWVPQSPVHMGAAPAGMLNRTRLYVPARAIWGAVVAEQARRTTTDFPDYQHWGTQVRQMARFSYLYPAEQTSHGWKAWLPHYEESRGLVWRREDSAQECLDHEFRLRVLSTQTGTAIEPDTDTASEATLREFELVSRHWQRTQNPSAIGFLGYIFIKEDSQDFLDVNFLMLGGDTRYGWGWVRQTSCEREDKFFGFQVDLSAAEPIIHTRTLLAHTLPDKSVEIRGNYEYLIGWDRCEDKLYAGGILWVPGSCCTSEVRVSVDEEGKWVIQTQGMGTE